jgi:hypothetical protein
MSVVLAAVGAAVAAFVQASILPFSVTTGGGLDLLLVLAIVWTMTIDFEGGLVWAFLGGLIIDVLLPARPFGVSAFILLLAVGVAWVVARLAPRATYPAAIVVTAIVGGVVSVLAPLLIGAMSSGTVSQPMAGVIPSILIGAFGAAILAPVPILIERRLRGDDTERLDW